MTLTDTLRKSVTRDELEQARTYRFMLSPMLGTSMLSLPADPPPYWSTNRDGVLKAAFRLDGLWSSSVHIAVTRISSLGYELDGDIGLRVKRAREMLGRDWGGLLQRFVKDFLTTDNGGFLEVVRATSAYASRVLGFVYLSSARCMRTGDPSVPVIYIDRLGQYHELRDYQVAEFSDLPDDDWNGVGFCATSRVYDALYEHAAVHAYFREKATGRRPLAVHFLSGMGQKQIEAAFLSAQEDADRKGILSYMGASVVGNPNEVPLTLVTVPLAELPDGFNQEQHEELTQIRYADALGIDPVDLNPRLIGNRALGAGSQAMVLDEKQSTKGLIALRQQLMHFFNDTERWHPLPAAVTFAWTERDLKDQRAEADISKVRADIAKVRIEAGITSAKQELQVQVDAGELPPVFLTIDQTPDETLTDEDKPEFSEEQAAQQAADQAVDQAVPEGAAVASPPVSPTPALPATGVGLAQKAVAQKADTTTLATVTPRALEGKRKPGRPSNAEKEYLAQVTKEFDEFGRIAALAMRQECPQSGEPGESGTTVDSIRYAVTNKNTRNVTLKWYVGNAERPEVAIRAVLYGRKGFGPKRAKALRFMVGGRPVFARKVKGVLQNDWFDRAWKAVQPQREAMQDRLNTALDVQTIAVGDVPGAIRRTKPSQIEAPA
jgi:hypothetical protein